MEGEVGGVDRTGANGAKWIGRIKKLGQGGCGRL